jgi:membrane protease YdiL (CAAX protease family)
MHFINHPPFWALAVFFPSLVFGYFRDRCDSVVPAITLHILYNFGYFVAVAF